MDDKTKRAFIGFIEEFKEALSTLYSSIDYLEEVGDGLTEGQKETKSDEKERISDDVEQKEP